MAPKKDLSYPLQRCDEHFLIGLCPGKSWHRTLQQTSKKLCRVWVSFAISLKEHRAFLSYHIEMQTHMSERNFQTFWLHKAHFAHCVLSYTSVFLFFIFYFLQVPVMCTNASP